MQWKHQGRGESNISRPDQTGPDRTARATRTPTRSSSTRRGVSLEPAAPHVHVHEHEHMQVQVHQESHRGIHAPLRPELMS